MTNDRQRRNRFGTSAIVLVLSLWLFACRPSPTAQLVVEIEALSSLAEQHQRDCRAMSEALARHVEQREEALEALAERLNDDPPSARELQELSAAMGRFQRASERCIEARLSIVALLG
ncbi:MAG: hypothetical protein RBU37_26535, partial [Myxococcota bacterium]|nr:hypothetical protein [Myxococcota bacterium]